MSIFLSVYNEARHDHYLEVEGGIRRYSVRPNKPYAITHEVKQLLRLIAGTENLTACNEHKSLHKDVLNHRLQRRCNTSIPADCIPMESCAVFTSFEFLFTPFYLLTGTKQ